MPGGFGNDHPLAGATPCNCPSFGKALPFLFLPNEQPDKEIIAIEAIKMNERFSIVYTLRVLANVMIILN